MKPLTVPAGSNLFRVAAQQLGDATQWIRIAMQNGLNDPFLPTGGQFLVTSRGYIAVDGNGNVLVTAPTINLTIPDTNLSATGGLPPA